MLTVAIASENGAYDAEIYRVVVEMVLGQPIRLHPTQRAFSGWKSVRDLADPYLRDARRQGVLHALLAVDNDGGSRRAPEHEEAHDPATEASSEDGCRYCWLSRVLPPWWSEGGGRSCVVLVSGIGAVHLGDQGHLTRVDG